MTLDMDAAKAEHGRAQAEAESRAVAAIGDRYGTASFKQGHRHGYWAGFRRGAEHPVNHDHEANARRHIEAAQAQQEREGEFDTSVRDNALLAQAEATLALAEQQRLANIIAWTAGYSTSSTVAAEVAAGLRMPPSDEAVF